MLYKDKDLMEGGEQPDEQKKKNIRQEMLHDERRGGGPSLSADFTKFMSEKGIRFSSETQTVKSISSVIHIYKEFCLYLEDICHAVSCLFFFHKYASFTFCIFVLCRF